MPLPATCEPGTYVIGNFSNANDCIECDAGFECPGGRAQPEECRSGSIAPTTRTGRCSPCNGGEYQEQSRSTACKGCAGGSYCPPGASAELPCLAGSYSSVPGLAYASNCTACPMGSACAAGSTAPTPCAPGTITATKRQSECSPCNGGEYQGQSGSTACQACIPGYYCDEGSSAPLPCPGGTHGDVTLTVMASVDDCMICPVGTFCSVGSAEPSVCTPGTYNDQLNASTCASCPAGSFQAVAGATACDICPVGGYCQRGATSPQLCPGGTSSNRTGIASERGCLLVLSGFWAPTGSAVPLACPPSGFLCPGAAADQVNNPPGSLPIQLPTGGISIERQVTREVLQLLTTLILDADVDSFDEVALKEHLARLYNARVEDITVSLGGGSVLVTVGLTAATPDAAAKLHRALNATSDAELSLALEISATRQPEIRIGSVNVTRTEVVQEACPPGFWCSAGYSYACKAGSFNPIANADSASACRFCAPGKYNPFEGQSSESSCLACPEGTANPKSGGASVDACVPCATGTFSGANGSDTCHPCSPGTYSDQRAATTCTTCEPGYYCTPATPIICSQNTYNSNPGAHLSTNCTACPGRFTSTLGLEGRTSYDDCACSRTFFLAPLTMNLTGMEDVCEERCCVCPIGTDCPGGVTLANLPVVPGYYRRSPDQIDVRRCPDASANCAPGESICTNSTSACRGGQNATNTTSQMCHSGLTGIFCRTCVEPSKFFVHAQQGAEAHCESCENAVSRTFWIIMAVLASVSLVTTLATIALARHSHQHMRSMVERLRKLLVDTYSVPNKIKILIASYQIMTKIEDVYEVTLPPAVRALLQQLRIIISFGIEGYPLACVGADGYEKRLLLWTFAPFVLALLAVLAVLVDLRLRRREQITTSLLFQNAMPAVLRIAFILYPIVTNVAFEAFSCFGFEDGRSWLIADVNIECDTDAYAQVTMMAGIAIVIYPVGLLVLNACILYWARDAIRTNQPTTLSTAAHFLYAEYKVRFFWWELMEMGRRFLLVGLYVIRPYHQGSIMQVACANLTAVIFLVLQLQAMPHRITFDNYLAIACSLSLTVMLLCTIFYKYVSLTELPGIRDRMSLELKNDYKVQGVVLSAIFIVCVFGGLVFSALITAEQVREERVRQQREARAAKARRLRWKADDTEVILGPPVIKACKPTGFAPTYNMGAVSERFHIFLSHVWGTGQDQMRIVKTRLLDMLPDSLPFLDVDSLAEGKGAEYVDASSVTLIFVSRGYFDRPNCMRELLRAVVTDKPMVTLVESEVAKGGLTKEHVLQKLVDAAAPCEKNGVPFSSMYAMWKLTKEMTEWGYEMPSADVLYAALFDKELIEWNRIGAFQDVSMRLVAESMLPQGRAKGTYLQGELTRLQPTLSAPRSGRTCHVYCSPHNVGAAALMQEVASHFKLSIKIAEDVSQLHTCERMLVYLTGLTWTSGEASTNFALEVQRAMDAKVPLLLCHEMPGVGGQEARHGCEFDLFFSNVDGATPQVLLQMDMYSQIATPLKGGAWRDVSMVMVAQGLTAPLPISLTSSDEIAKDITCTKGEAEDSVPAEVLPTTAAPRKALVSAEVAPEDGEGGHVSDSRRSHLYDYNDDKGLREAPPRANSLLLSVREATLRAKRLEMHNARVSREQTRQREELMAVRLTAEDVPAAMHPDKTNAAEQQRFEEQKPPPPPLPPPLGVTAGQAVTAGQTTPAKPAKLADRTELNALEDGSLGSADREALEALRRRSVHRGPSSARRGSSATPLSGGTGAGVMPTQAKPPPNPLYAASHRSHAADADADANADNPPATEPPAASRVLSSAEAAKAKRRAKSAAHTPSAAACGAPPLTEKEGPHGDQSTLMAPPLEV